MKPSHWISAALAATAALAGTRPAHADDDTEPTVNNLSKNASYSWTLRHDAHEGDSWKPDDYHARRCVTIADKMAKAGTPDSMTVDMEINSKDLKRGPHTFAEVRAMCRDAHMQTLVPTLTEGAAHDLLENFDASGAIDPDDSAKMANVPLYVKNCFEEYKEIVDAKLDLTQQVTVHFGDRNWKGPLAQVKTEFCDKGKAALDKAFEKQLEPYVKAGMKGDKLAMIKENGGSTYYQIAGGESTLDPVKLTKANVWFEFFEGDECARGKIETMHRYQFDKAGKLVKNTVREFCGDPPKSAYK